MRFLNALLLALLFIQWQIMLVLAQNTSTTTTSTTDIPMANNNSTVLPLPRRRPTPRVKLNKCCRFGEYLDATQTCVAGNTELWVPLIYLINRNSYHLPHGGSPKSISFEENSRPISMDGAKNGGCTVDSELEHFTGSTNVLIFSNGSLFLNERAQLIEPRNYCVDRESALVCFPKNGDIPQPRLKLRKCCGKYGQYETTTNACVVNSAVKSDGKLKLPNLNESSYQTVYGFPKCQEALSSYAIAGAWQDAKLYEENGELELHDKNFSTTEYCLEYIKGATHDNYNLTMVKVFVCLHHFTPAASETNNAMPTVEDTTTKLQNAVLHFSIVISVVFLAATLVAGYMMPSVHHVLHWRCQIYYVFCLLVGDFLLAFTQISHSVKLNMPVCLLLASCMHFFFLSAFFWLNIMCFNIWWTFRDFRPSSLERNQEVLRLRLYSAYAWGIPLLITVIAACVNIFPDSTLLRPGFGVHGCWFSGEHWPMFAYFFGPIGLLLCANIVLFISTTHQLTCGLWKRDDVKSTTEKTALVQVCLKLVIVMGITWIADVASWLIGGPDSVWFFTDIINALQGVFIFIVVGCQPQVWSACKRFCCPRSRQEITNTTNGVQHSSSSQGLPSVVGCTGETTQNTSINTTVGESMVTAAAPVRDQSRIPMETVC